MSAKKALYQFLSHAGGISGLVSGRIYPMGEQPQTVAFPYITFMRISRNPQRHFGGGSGLARARYQIDVWARREIDVERVVDAISDSIDNFRGEFGSSVYNVTTAAAFIEDDEETIESPADGTERPIFRGRLDVTIWHAESVTPV